MKVKLLISRVGVNFSQNRGEIIEVDEAEAMRMIKADQAEPVTVKETATKKPATKKR